MADPIISVQKLHKEFKLPHQQAESIKNVFTGRFSFFKKKSVEKQVALDDINFEIQPGEFFGIVGRNGSGKSTLLKLLAGIYQPTSGTVAVGGRIVPFIELGVGFNGELTGRENVYLNGSLMGFSEKEIAKKYDDIVDFAELGRFMDQKLKNYSSGMQVRLAFSVATRLAESDILLIDEVLAVGDADFQRKCFQFFKKLKKDKKTVVFVTHDMGAVREYCDRAAFIEKSKLVAIGPANEIAGKYTRMFTEGNAAAGEQVDSKRWGDNIGMISSVKAVNAKVKKMISIELRAKSAAELSEPIIGYVIKNAAGQSLLGSNTKIENMDTGDYAPGDPIRVKWEIPDIFSDGVYYVDVAVVRDDGISVVDWWEGAAQFTTFEDTPSPYLVSPSITTKIGDKN